MFRTILVLLLSLSLLLGCDQSTSARFEIVVGNRVHVPITVYLDGEMLGEVPGASTAQFSKVISLSKSTPKDSDTEATFAYVTISAVSVPFSERSRQSISRSFGLELYDDVVNEIEFDYRDFDQYIRIGEMDFTFTVQNRTDDPLKVTVNGNVLIERLDPQSVAEAVSILT
jgi:hypothetical protein